MLYIYNYPKKKLYKSGVLSILQFIVVMIKSGNFKNTKISFILDNILEILRTLSK